MIAKLLIGIRRTTILGLLLFPLIWNHAALSDEASAVTVHYASGRTEPQTLKDGVPIFSNRKYELAGIDPELNGLTFALRSGGLKSPTVTISAPARATVYVLLDSDKGDNAGDKGVLDLHQALVKSGWVRLADISSTKKGLVLAVYRRTFAQAEEFTLPEAGFSGVIVAAKQLSVAVGKDPHSGDAKGDAKGETNRESGGQGKSDSPAVAHARPQRQTGPMAGPTTRIARRQSTIKALYIKYTASGMMLGSAWDFILTVSPGTTPNVTAPEFVMPVGDEMAVAVDDVLRCIHVKYPNWLADKAEFTFGADKYEPHDGCSIGAAVGTLILSVIEGFEIDPNLAMTGDVSANGRINPIGGVAAKLRGAVAAHCSVVAMPVGNFDQVVDAMLYDGSPATGDVQIIGIATLDDAVAVARTDRDVKLSQAITLFAELQKQLKDSPKDLHTPAVQEKAAKVLALAPQHLSARWLLMLAQNRQPRTLSASASYYYTNVAVMGMMPLLNDRVGSKSPQIPSATVRDGLAALEKLRPLADPKLQPLLDAWSRFIRVANEVESGHASLSALETQRQALVDAESHIRADQDLMEKMPQ